MDSGSTARWQERTVQLLVRYEALFKLLDEIQQLEGVEEISQRVAKQWKYFANVTSWRLVLPQEDGFTVIDGFRGEARLSHHTQLHPWDAHHLQTRIPRLQRSDESLPGLDPPAHLSGKGVTEIQVLPFMRLGQCIGLLSVAARHESFNDLDLKFVRTFGSHFTDRLSSIQLRRQAMEALQRKATRDALTGLLNRGAIIEHLDRQLALSAERCEPLSLVLADVDFFKVVNDNHGHLVGDQILRAVAQQLKNHTLTRDCVGRYGGEEFLLVLYPCSSEEVERAAERFRRAVAESSVSIGQDPPIDLSVTISLGAASTTGHERMRLEELIKRADNALYESKRAGRNRVTLG